jgi:uncharacterized protein (TIGR03118 family)
MQPTDRPADFLPQPLEPRVLFAHPSAYAVTNLVSDGSVAAAHTDANLVNAWGIAFNPAFDVVWVANNGSGNSTVYHPDGSTASTPVTIPPPQGGAAPSAPTGEVFNASKEFVVTSGNASAAAAYVWATEDGTISAWNPTVDANNAILEVDNSSNDAVYKGLATAKVSGHSFLYATDFHNNKIDVFDGSFHAATLKGNFTDPNLPAGFAPFGIQELNGKLYVTYAKQDADAHDDVKGVGNGFVDIFSNSGQFQKRFASAGALNSPWGVSKAPSGFGTFGGDILIGNFGDGLIQAFNGGGHSKGFLSDSNGTAITIDGLWGITPGPSKTDKHTLFFASGPNDEANGLFGAINVVKKS